MRHGLGVYTEVKRPRSCYKVSGLNLVFLLQTLDFTVFFHFFYLFSEIGTAALDLPPR
jgi:hypothetical protein